MQPAANTLDERVLLSGFIGLPPVLRHFGDCLQALPDCHSGLPATLFVRRILRGMAKSLPT